MAMCAPSGWVLVGAAAVGGVVFTAVAQVPPDPRERIAYWQANYEELRPQDDPRARRAHEIFGQVLGAAGKRAGTMPRLYITKKDPLNVALPISIPDGSIVLSRSALNRCYERPGPGDDRLAFVLAHEIAHQLKDDFWHMRFFQAIALSRKDALPEEAEILEEIRAIAKGTDDILAKELQADEMGIVYAAMGGFDTAAIVGGPGNANFFLEWVEALDPNRIGVIPKDRAHPNPEQRSEAVRARLRQVVDKIAIFDLGVRFFETEDYDRARAAFQEFARYFPSREVYHDLACCHHELALEAYAAWKGMDLVPRFLLSTTLEATTRANKISSRGDAGEGAEARFRKNIQQAIELYKSAIYQDPDSLISHNNLGCALILSEDPYQAIATLQKALKITPESKEVLNNLGVAFFLAENPAKAKEYLYKARTADARYAAPPYNLGEIASAEGSSGAASQFWNEYLDIEHLGPRPDAVRHRLSLHEKTSAPAAEEKEPVESVLGAEIGFYEDELPQDWTLAEEKQIGLEEEPYLLKTFASGVSTVSQGAQIRLIAVPGEFTGRTVRGIQIGSADSAVLSAYGPPSSTLKTTRGQSWIYRSRGIAFQIRDRKVVSWLLYRR